MNYIINKTHTAVGGAGKLISMYHYIGTMAPGCRHIFELINPDTGEIVGAAQVGVCAGRLAMKGRALEIRRFVLIPGLPKNTASFFLGYIVRWFKKNSKIKKLISYADQNENHKGTIYKAANFSYVGESKRTEVIRYRKKDYHLRTIYGSGGARVGNGVDIRKMLKQKKAKRVYLKPKLKFEYVLR